MTPPSERARHAREHADPIVRTGVLFFSTPGCAACRTVRSHIARLGDPGEIPIVEIDAGTETASVARHRVLAAPTLIALHDGVEVARRTGAVSAEVLDELHIAATAGTRIGRSSAANGLIVLRLLVAAVLLLAGGITATPTLTVVGAALALWPLASMTRKMHELRTH